MGEIYKHQYTWLKIFLITYVIEILLACTIAGRGSSLADAGIYIFVLFTALLGLFFGFIINIFTRFRNAVLCYIIGHILCIACLYIAKELLREEQPIETPQEHNADFKEHTSEFFNYATKYAIETVFYKMEETYPAGGYTLDQLQTDYVSGDTTGNSGIICTIIFTLPEENNTRYISQYYAKTDSIAAIYEKKDTTTMEYKKFRKELLKLENVVEELQH